MELLRFIIESTNRSRNNNTSIFSVTFSLGLIYCILKSILNKFICNGLGGDSDLIAQTVAKSFTLKNEFTHNWRKWVEPGERELKQPKEESHRGRMLQPYAPPKRNRTFMNIEVIIISLPAAFFSCNFIRVPTVLQS